MAAVCSLTGVIVCDTIARRTSAKAAVAQYAAQHGLSTDPVTVDIPAGKYGAGPTFLLVAWFDVRADADAAWSTVDGLGLGWVMAGSYLTEADGSTIVHNDVWDPVRRSIV